MIKTVIAVSIGASSKKWKSGNSGRLSMGNLQIWDKAEKTDPAFTKPFNRGGGFKGTATNATYLAKKATEIFGPMGIGWGVEIMDEALMEGGPLDDRGTKELIHKVRVKLWYKLGDQRGEVVQFGQTAFVTKNKNGIVTDEEAPKKSLTDGMSKCLSLLGFSADIHMGRYDDNKYVEEVGREFQQKKEVEKKAAAPKINEDQIVELNDLINEAKADGPAMCKFFKIATLNDLPASDYARAKGMLMKKRDRSA